MNDPLTKLIQVCRPVLEDMESACLDLEGCYEFINNIRDVLNALPKTGDDVFVTPGMVIWIPANIRLHECSKPFSETLSQWCVSEISTSLLTVTCSAYKARVFAHRCFSTREAADPGNYEI